MNPPTSLILPPLSAIFKAVTRARLLAYRRGLFSVSRLPAPVISVGNLTTGGTGKTPLVEWVCRAIADSGGRVDAQESPCEKENICVLSRGYGRSNPKTQVVVSNGIEILADEREAGDEPFLLAQKLLGLAAVICNSNRVAAGEWAIENLKADVFVLDDGFQHLRLARDLDIVAVDATNPWGGGSLLPYGRLREARSGLSRADCVVITRTEQVENLNSVKEAISEFTGSAPIFCSRMTTSGIFGIDGEIASPSTLRDEPIGAFCGVGNPESFFNHLRREGFKPIFTRAFADHHNYEQSELDALVQDTRSSGATSLITTAKDAIRLRSLNLEIPCYILEIQISIDEDERLIEMIRDAICKPRPETNSR
jgi:tetraacyldisaccharide 4'-kinase